MCYAMRFCSLITLTSVILSGFLFLYASGNSMKDASTLAVVGHEPVQCPDAERALVGRITEGQTRGSDCAVTLPSQAVAPYDIDVRLTYFYDALLNVTRYGLNLVSNADVSTRSIALKIDSRLVNCSVPTTVIHHVSTNIHRGYSARALTMSGSLTGVPLNHQHATTLVIKTTTGTPTSEQPEITCFASAPHVCLDCDTAHPCCAPTQQPPPPVSPTVAVPSPMVLPPSAACQGSTSRDYNLNAGATSGTNIGPVSGPYPVSIRSIFGVVITNGSSAVTSGNFYTRFPTLETPRHSRVDYTVYPTEADCRASTNIIHDIHIELTTNDTVPVPTRDLTAYCGQVIFYKARFYATQGSSTEEAVGVSSSGDQCIPQGLCCVAPPLVTPSPTAEPPTPVPLPSPSHPHHECPRPRSHWIEHCTGNQSAEGSEHNFLSDITLCGRTVCDILGVNGKAEHGWYAAAQQYIVYLLNKANGVPTGAALDAIAEELRLILVSHCGPKKGLLPHTQDLLVLHVLSQSLLEFNLNVTHEECCTRSHGSSPLNIGLCVAAELNVNDLRDAIDLADMTLTAMSVEASVYDAAWEKDAYGRSTNQLSTVGIAVITVLCILGAILGTGTVTLGVIYGWKYWKKRRHYQRHLSSMELNEAIGLVDIDAEEGAALSTGGLNEDATHTNSRREASAAESSSEELSHHSYYASPTRRAPLHS